jgi:proline dehydrogenase
MSVTAVTKRMQSRWSSGPKTPLSLLLCLVRMLFDCFDVPTRRALVGDQFGQTTEPRHAADGGQPFTVASAVVGQFLKFG